MTKRYLSSAACRAGRAGAVAATLALALAGCASGDDSLKPAAEAFGLATTAQEPRPFVVQSRTATADYIPVGTSGARMKERRPVAELKAMEGALEARRLRNEVDGARARRMGETAPAVTAPLPTN